jgi:hypothetical protein
MLYVMQELIRIIDDASPTMWRLIRKTLKGAIDRELKPMSVLMEEVPIQKKKLTPPPHPCVRILLCVCPHTAIYRGWA